MTSTHSGKSGWTWCWSSRWVGWDGVSEVEEGSTLLYLGLKLKNGLTLGLGFGPKKWKQTKLCSSFLSQRDGISLTGYNYESWTFIRLSWTNFCARLPRQISRPAILYCKNQEHPISKWCKILVYVFVTSRQDYCNSLLSSSPNKYLFRLSTWFRMLLQMYCQELGKAIIFLSYWLHCIGSL